MVFLLAHQILLAPGSTARATCFLLHGIYGSGRNWKTFATQLAAAVPGLEIVLVDLRNHGASQGAPPPHTIVECAKDLVALATHLGRNPEIVCGHSFGGKVALAYATLRPVGLERLLILDSPAGRGRPEEPTATEAGKVLTVMQRMPLPIASRAEAGRAIEQAGVAKGVAQWMATNLRAEPTGGYVWHFDLDALEAMLRNYREFDGYPLLESADRPFEIHYVRAGKSDRFTHDDIARLEALAAAGRIQLHVLPDAGHWLHVDDPDGLLRVLAPLMR